MVVGSESIPALNNSLQFDRNESQSTTHFVVECFKPSHSQQPQHFDATQCGGIVRDRGMRKLLMFSSNALRFIGDELLFGAFVAVVDVAGAAVVVVLVGAAIITCCPPIVGASFIFGFFALFFSPTSFFCEAQGVTGCIAPSSTPSEQSQK